MVSEQKYIKQLAKKLFNAQEQLASDLEKQIKELQEELL